jgi:hypothetical protein
MFFQLTIGAQSGVLPQANSDQALFFLILGWILVAVIIGVLFIVRAIYKSQSRSSKAFNRVVMRVMVPKERKSEGQGGQVGADDRLEQVKEEIAITDTFFSTIAGLRAQKGLWYWLVGRTDHFSFEIVVHNQMISFYADVPRKMQQFFQQQIHAQFPQAQIDEMTDYNIFSEKSAIIGAYVTNTEHDAFPFKTYKDMESDPLSALLNPLSKITGDDDAAAIQFVIYSAHKKWRRKGVDLIKQIRRGQKPGSKRSGVLGAVSDVGATFIRDGFGIGNPKSSNGDSKDKKEYTPNPTEEETMKGIEEKLSRGGLGLTVRVLSVSNNEESARLNLDNIIGSFSQMNLYRQGNSFRAVMPKNQAKLIREFIYRSYDEKRGFVVSTTEMSSLWHPPLHSTEAPNIKWLSGRRSAPPANLPQNGLYLGYVPYRGTKTDVFMKEGDRRRHQYIVGKSGSGKSMFIQGLAIQDIKAGHGVAVVDPHGDLIEDILAHIPKERADDVIIFDPSDMERPIGLNMLEAKTEDQKDFAVQEMISIFYKLFPPEMIGPMFEHNMRNVMLTLMADLENPGTIIDIPRMFTDDEYVKVYLDKVTDPVVRAFWEKEMAKTSDFHKSEMLGYLVSKVGRFVGNEMMRNIMGQRKSGFDFREAMDNKKILLVNLAKGKTGEVNAKLLGLIIVAKLQMAAMGRADMAEEDRHDFYLYIDEFQNFITDSISTILSEARKYKLDLIIAHQYMGQLVDDKGKADVRDAVLGNVGTMCVGRVGPDDSEILAKEFAPVFGSYDLLNPPPYSWYTKLLIDGKAARPFNLASVPVEEGNRKVGAAIKELSRLKFGRERGLVEHELMERTKLGDPAIQGDSDSAEATL